MKSLKIVKNELKPYVPTWIHLKFMILRKKSAELHVEHETILYEVWDNTLNRCKLATKSMKNI